MIVQADQLLGRPLTSFAASDQLPAMPRRKRRLSPGPEVLRTLVCPAWGLQEGVEFVELSAYAAAYLFAELEYAFVGD